MSDRLTRRDVLAHCAAAGAVAFGAGVGGKAAQAARGPDAARSGGPFPLCLNTSTLRGHKLPVTEVIDIAAEAGYDGIELWVDEIGRHVAAGGTLKDLAKRLVDRGLVVTGAIAFFHWMVDDDAKRTAACEQAKRYMAQLAEIHATHIAAPPCGNVKDVDLLHAADRYRELLKIGEAFRVVPAVEIWGPAKNLHRLGQAAMVAIEANHPNACILPDVYHLYKGGSGLAGIGRLNANLLAGFHLNDYPADPPREKIADRHRLYPGDGIAPLGGLIRDLHTIGYRGPLSVELFNPDHARQDPALVAKTAMDKTRAVVRAALGKG